MEHFQTLSETVLCSLQGSKKKTTSAATTLTVFFFLCLPLSDTGKASTTATAGQFYLNDCGQITNKHPNLCPLSYKTV
jgi:hypothetical protein